MTQPNPTTLTNLNGKKTHFNAELLVIYKTMKTQFQGSSHFHLSPSRYMILIYKILILTLSNFCESICREHLALSSSKYFSEFLSCAHPHRTFLQAIDGT